MLHIGDSSSVSRGFTLIELLVVIAVLGILASVVMVAINPSQQLARARDSQRKQDVGVIYNAIENYSTMNGGKYPCSVDYEPDSSSFCNGPYYGTVFFSNNSYNTNFLDVISTTGLLKQVPRDPLTPDSNTNSEPFYSYIEGARVAASGVGFEVAEGSVVVSARLEDRSDGSCIKNSDGTTVYTPTTVPTTCMYVLQNGEIVSQWNP